MKWGNMPAWRNLTVRPRAQTLQWRVLPEGGYEAVLEVTGMVCEAI